MNQMAQKITEKVVIKQPSLYNVRYGFGGNDTEAIQWNQWVRLEVVMKANAEQAKYDKALREKMVNYFSLGEFNILCMVDIFFEGK